MSKIEYYSDDDEPSHIPKVHDETTLEYETGKKIDEQSDIFLDQSRKLWDTSLKPYLKTCTIKQPLSCLQPKTHGSSTYKFINYIINNNKSVKDIFNGKYVNSHD